VIESCLVDVRKELLPNWATLESLPEHGKLVTGGKTYKIQGAQDTGLALAPRLPPLAQRQRLMKLNVEHETARLNRVLRDVQPALRRSMNTLVKDGAKLALRKGIEMTPPGEAGMQPQEAKKRG